MISKKDYNEIYLKGYEDGKNDNNNLKIHYEIKPSFTTRKLKELQKENEQLKTNWNKLKEYLNYQSERAVGEDEYVYDEIYNEMQELEQGSDENLHHIENNFIALDLIGLRSYNEKLRRKIDDYLDIRR